MAEETKKAEPHPSRADLIRMYYAAKDAAERSALVKKHPALGQIFSETNHHVDVEAK